MKKNVTIKDVAGAAGVSTMTVSRVLNDRPDVSDETRQRVQRVIDELGYSPHLIARSLVRQKSQIIGLVIPRAVNTVFVDPFFPVLLQSITEAASQHGYHLILSMLNSPEQEQDFYQRAVRSHMLDGILIAAAMLDDPIIPQLQADQTPFVVIGRVPEYSDITTIDVDNDLGAQLAVEHLFAAGKQRIATITGPLDTSVGIDRLSGYRRALNNINMLIEEELIMEGDFTERGAYEAMQALLPHQPDAVFVASDLMALGAMRAIRTAGLCIPEDIAVVGFDDTELAEVAEPPLTTVRQPIDELGTQALAMLFALMKDNVVKPKHVTLATTLVVRESST